VRTGGIEPPWQRLEGARSANDPNPHRVLAESCEHDSHALPHRPLSKRRPRPGGLTLRMVLPAGVEPASTRLEDGRLSVRATGAKRMIPKSVERFSDKIMRKAVWMRRRVPTPLVAVLQTAAFPFRHGAIGSPSRNRTEVGRVRAGCFAAKLRGDWSGCGVLPTGVRVPNAGLFLHELHPVVWRAREDSNLHLQLRLRIAGSYPASVTCAFGASSGFRPHFTCLRDRYPSH
jgi:hypothetical protein